MLELYQAEWCPSSHRVRERLTELGVDYVAHQVPVERSARRALLSVAGVSSIPALRLEDGSAVVGEDAIALYLDEVFAEPPGAEAHRAKADEFRRRLLAEECECAEPAREQDPYAGLASAGSLPPT